VEDRSTPNKNPSCYSRTARLGAMPPFGNLCGVPTYVDKSLAQEEYIVFEAGTHTDAIKLRYYDYEKIVQPRVEDLAIKLQPMKGGMRLRIAVVR
jgi:hypothetical protein